MFLIVFNTFFLRTSEKNILTKNIILCVILLISKISSKNNIETKNLVLGLKKFIKYS